VQRCGKGNTHGVLATPASHPRYNKAYITDDLTDKLTVHGRRDRIVLEPTVTDSVM